MNFPIYYAESGINWEFLYQVEYEDDDILILRDLGRYHKFDTDRMFTKPIEKYLDNITNASGLVYVGNKLKCVEIKPEIRR